MRIEGTYTFPVPARHLRTALGNPELLARALPGCERLTQMGPTDADGITTYEVRVRLQPETPPLQATVRVSAPSEREARAEVSGAGAGGPVSAHGIFTLLDQGQQTRATYFWETSPTSTDDHDASNACDAGERLVQAFCAHLDTLSREPGQGPSGAGPLLAETPRGRIVRQAQASGETQTQAVVSRALLVGAGAVVGLSLLVLSMRVLRRLSGGRDGN